VPKLERVAQTTCSLSCSFFFFSRKYGCELEASDDFSSAKRVVALLKERTGFEIKRED